MWESESWRLSDNGIVFYESPLDGKSKVTKGVQYFGITGKDKVFSLLPEDKNIPVTLNQIRKLNTRNVTREGRLSPPVLKVSDGPVLVRQNDLELLHKRLVTQVGRRLVMVV